MTTTDKDLGMAAILAQAELLKGAYIDTGIFEGDTHPETDEYSLAQIGAANEFGAPKANVPERSWLRRGADENKSKWNEQAVETLERVMESKGKLNLLNALMAMGERYASDVRKTIDKVTSPAKKASTIRAEGGALKRTKTGQVKKGAKEFQARFTHPLVWTGTMRASVRSRINLAGKQKETAKAK